MIHTCNSCGGGLAGVVAHVKPQCYSKNMQKQVEREIWGLSPFPCRKLVYTTTVGIETCSGSVEFWVVLSQHHVTAIVYEPHTTAVCPNMEWC
jgi:hypothetical protein